MLADTFPPEKRPQAFALYGIAVIVAPTVGPTLGGWITDNYSWHWIFFINVPIGLLSLALVQWLVVEPEVLERERARAARRRTQDRLGGIRPDRADASAASKSCSTAARSRTGFIRPRSSSSPRSRPARSCSSFPGSSRTTIRSSTSACSAGASSARVPGDARGRRHSVRLEPDHAAADADEFSLHGDAVRLRDDARAASPCWS